MEAHHPYHRALSCDSGGLRLKIERCCVGLSLWPCEMYSIISALCLISVRLCLSPPLSQSRVRQSPLPSLRSQTLWAPPTPSAACWVSPNPAPRARGVTMTVRIRSNERDATQLALFCFIVAGHGRKMEDGRGCCFIFWPKNILFLLVLEHIIVFSNSDTFFRLMFSLCCIQCISILPEISCLEMLKNTSNSFI